MTLILRSVGLVLAGALVVTAVLGMRQEDSVVVQQDAVFRPLSVGFAPLPAVNPKAGPSIIERSPFARERTPFDREALLSVPTAPVEIRLTGIFKLGGEMSASLVVGGKPLTVRKGSETPAGIVGRVESAAVEFEDGRRIEMFKQ